MKIVYMGTPDFAVGPLAAIAEAGYEIGYAVTQQDKARNRGKKFSSHLSRPRRWSLTYLCFSRRE